MPNNELKLRFKDSENHLLVDKKLLLNKQGSSQKQPYSIKSQSKSLSMPSKSQGKDNSRTEFKKMVNSELEMQRQLFGGMSNNNSKSHLKNIEEVDDHVFEEESFKDPRSSPMSSTAIKNRDGIYDASSLSMSSQQNSMLRNTR